MNIPTSVHVYTILWIQITFFFPCSPILCEILEIRIHSGLQGMLYKGQGPTYLNYFLGSDSTDKSSHCMNLRTPEPAHLGYQVFR